MGNQRDGRTDWMTEKKPRKVYELVGINDKEGKFSKWYDSLEKEEKARVTARLTRVEDPGQLGNVKAVTPGGKTRSATVYEFRLVQKQGGQSLRIYFVPWENDTYIVLLDAGDKQHASEQNKDIQRASRAWEAYLAYETYKETGKYPSSDIVQSLKAERHPYLMQGSKLIAYELPGTPEKAG